MFSKRAPKKTTTPPQRFITLHVYIQGPLPCTCDNVVCSSARCGTCSDNYKTALSVNFSIPNIARPLASRTSASVSTHSHHLYIYLQLLNMDRTQRGSSVNEQSEFQCACTYTCCTCHSVNLLQTAVSLTHCSICFLMFFLSSLYQSKRRIQSPLRVHYDKRGHLQGAAVSTYNATLTQHIDYSRVCKNRKYVSFSHITKSLNLHLFTRAFTVT